MRLLRYAPSDSSTYLKYASGVLGRKPCIHIRLRRLATNPCEKCGLGSDLAAPCDLSAEALAKADLSGVAEGEAGNLKPLQGAGVLNPTRPFCKYL